MEKRSIVLSALVLAFLVAGGFFYGVGRDFGVEPAQLATGPDSTVDAIPVNIESDEDVQQEDPTSLSGDNVTGSTEDAQVTSVAENNPADDATRLIAPAADASAALLPSADADESEMVAGSSDVAATAETGTATNILLASVLAIFLGVGGVVSVSRIRL